VLKTYTGMTENTLW